MCKYYVAETKGEDYVWVLEQLLYLKSFKENKPVLTFFGSKWKKVNFLGHKTKCQIFSVQFY